MLFILRLFPYMFVYSSYFHCIISIFFCFFFEVFFSFLPAFSSDQEIFRASRSSAKILNRIEDRETVEECISEFDVSHDEPVIPYHWGKIWERSSKQKSNISQAYHEASYLRDSYDIFNIIVISKKTL